jgi:hypothetical protein
MFLRDPLVQVLALKLGKLASEQSGIALNIPPVTQNFAGLKSIIVVTSRRWPTIVLRMGSGEFAASADSTARLRVKRQRGQSGIVPSAPTKKNPVAGGA